MADTFTPFLSLPAELRRDIWKLHFLPRVIGLYLPPARDAESVQWRASCRNYAGLSACSEARTVGLKGWSRIPIDDNGSLYFNPTVDTLVFLELELGHAEQLNELLALVKPKRIGLPIACLQLEFVRNILRRLPSTIEQTAVILSVQPSQRTISNGEYKLESWISMSSLAARVAGVVDECKAGASCMRLMRLDLISASHKADQHTCRIRDKPKVTVSFNELEDSCGLDELEQWFNYLLCLLDVLRGALPPLELCYGRHKPQNRSPGVLQLFANDINAKEIMAILNMWRAHGGWLQYVDTDSDMTI